MRDEIGIDNPDPRCSLLFWSFARKNTFCYSNPHITEESFRRDNRMSNLTRKWEYEKTLRNFHRQFGTPDYYRNGETWERTQIAERELAAADAAENAPL